MLKKLIFAVDRMFRSRGIGLGENDLNTKQNPDEREEQRGVFAPLFFTISHNNANRSLRV